MNNYPQLRAKWDELIKSEPKPLHLRNCLSFEYSEFVETVMSDDFEVAAQLVENVYAGDALIFKNALNEESIQTLKSRATSFGASVASTRLRIVDGCPDWHEINDGQGVPEGGYQTLDHSFYFFRWNDTGKSIFETIDEAWRIGKIFNGLPPDAFNSNSPNDDVVDRIQIIQYPKGGGLISPHQDPDIYMKCNLGFYLTTKHTDYQEGGFFIVDGDGKQKLLEDSIGSGCLLIWYASLPHGVIPVDPKAKLDWSSSEGRWFAAANSVQPHGIKERRYAVPYSFD